MASNKVGPAQVFPSGPGGLGPDRDLDAIANAIWAVRLRYPWLTVVLVEGSDDSILFERHVDLNRCQLQVANGRPRALGLLERTRARSITGVLAVIDGDYDRLLGRPTADADLIVTDTHDVEMMLFRSTALDHVLRELGDAQRIANVTANHLGGVRGPILDAAARIGAARLVCRRFSWSVQFEGIEYDRFVEERTLDVDPGALLRELRGRQAGAEAHERMTEEAAALFASEEARGHPPWDLCQGHDVVAILAIALRRLIGRKRASEVKPERLEMALRLAFDAAQFQASSLYRDIATWETQNPGYSVL